MTREEAARVLKYLWIERDENAKLMQQLTKSFFERQEALRIGAAALRGPQADPKTGLVPCGGKMRIDIPPGNDSVRASTGFQRDGGDKTERRCNQCIHCGQEMPEGDQVCGHCRRQHGY